MQALGEVARILEMRSARTVFMSPAVPATQKAAALDRMLPNAAPLIRNFLHILIDRDRLDEVPEILEALRGMVNEQRGIITANVTTAIPLDPDMERLVAQRLAAHFGREPQNVTIQSRVDPATIGGV